MNEELGLLRRRKFRHQVDHDGNIFNLQG